MSASETWRLFWAKTDYDGRLGYGDAWSYPLWAHLLDVANAALVLWRCFIPTVLREKMAKGIGMAGREDEAGRFLSFWIGLHDLGKAIPSFQFMKPEASYLARLKQDGLDLSYKTFYRPEERLHHGHASISVLYRYLERHCLQVNDLLEAMAAFVGFHHGKLIHAGQWRKNAASRRGKLGDDAWCEAQLALAEAVEQAWQPVWPEGAVLMDECPDWLLGFAGWATLADWLGSMKEHYPHAPKELHAHLNVSCQGAEKAFRAAGLHLSAALQIPSFSELFGFAPRDLQSRMASLPLDLKAGPTLTIVEGPTGEGKTEGAFYLAARQQTPYAPGGGLYPLDVRYLSPHPWG